MKEHREVVFLPYKVSMWDSLESIWEAADKDPNCNACVIPIPYYDRKPDGTFGEMHYEGSLYPNDVPVIDYRAYDFAGRHPDIIIIHNPYDEYNYVTSVHPFFYAKNLRQYTDMLVYVPYFTLYEIRPDDQKSVAEIEHFCILPGVIWADCVIVQSEAMRQIYINVLRRIVEGQGRIAWERKILGIGSPKTDRLRKLKKEGFRIPEGWKKHLYRSDGSRKKVVLYNIGLKTLPQYREKMLEKIQDVLQLFWKSREEVALLLRPHPLLQVTLKSVDFSLYEAYRRIEEQYRREGWGIYDDTADVERAVLLCDAYYGDTSSVAQLCMEAGKTVLIQNTETGIYDQELLLSRALICENLYDDGSSFWFTSYDYNGLFRMEKEQCEPELAGIFPDEELLQGRLYTAVAACSGKLYFAPFSAKEIAEYDLEKNVFRKIPIVLPDKEGYGLKWEYEKFFKIVVVDENLYIIPYAYPGILYYDTRQAKLTCFDDWVEKIEELRVSEWGYFVGYEIYEDRILLPCLCADAIVIFDTCMKTSQVIQTSKTVYPCKYCGICRNGEYFYLLSADGTMQKRKQDAIEEETETIHLPVSGSDDIAFYPMQSSGEYLYFFPVKKCRGIRMNIRTGRLEQESRFDDERNQGVNSFSFLVSGTDSKKLYAVTGNSRCFVKYDFDGKSRQEVKLFLSEKDRLSLEKQKTEDFIRWNCRDYVTETVEYSIIFMLDMLRNNSSTLYKSSTDNDVPVGKQIYDMLISE